MTLVASSPVKHCHELKCVQKPQHPRGGASWDMALSCTVSQCAQGAAFLYPGAQVAHCTHKQIQPPLVLHPKAQKHHDSSH